jgi:hypothetical protein
VLPGPVLNHAELVNRAQAERQDVECALRRPPDEFQQQPAYGLRLFLLHRMVVQLTEALLLDAVGFSAKI